MPEDFYKVGLAAKRQFDNIGLRALQHDWAAWLVEPSDDLMKRSQFNLLYDIRVHLFGRNSGQAREYAMLFHGEASAGCAENSAAGPTEAFWLVRNGVRR